MTGPEHYREAERLLTEAEADDGAIGYPEVVAAAQVHATLAVAAATATTTVKDPRIIDVEMWRLAAGEGHR